MSFSIFTTQIPAIPNANDGLTQNLGTVFTTSVDGNVTHIRWYFPATLPTGTVIGALWLWTSDGTGTLLGQANFTAPVAGTWNTAQLSVPIAITNGVYYVASIFSQDQYVATGALFNVAITNGPLTAPADDSVTPRRNGKFLQNAGGLTYPTSFFNGNGYFPDIVFEPPPTDVAPDSLQLTATEGAPTLSDGSMTITPNGIQLPVTLGNPTVAGPPLPGILDPVLEMYQQALLCLCAAVNVNPNPPQHCSARIGLEIPYDTGQFADQCCEGVAYIALGDMYLSTDNFPDQDIIKQIRGSCYVPTWAVEFKLGIIRCAPAGQADGEPPTDAQWTAAAYEGLLDAQALRRAACCFQAWVLGQTGTLYDGMSVVINRQVQTTPQGGCVERYMTLTAQFPNLDCAC